MLRPAQTAVKLAQGIEVSETTPPPFVLLGTIPESTRLDSATQESIQRGVPEIDRLLHKPLETAQYHLDMIQAKKEGYQRFQEQAEELVAAYEFFDEFFESLSAAEQWQKKEFPPLLLELQVYEREIDGEWRDQQVTFIFTSQTPMGRLGTREKDDVYQVEIDFTLYPEHEEAYTEQAVKFRARGKKRDREEKGPELACLRAEIHVNPKFKDTETEGENHTREERKPIQVDIDTIEPYSRKHLPVSEFGDNLEVAAGRFRDAQVILLFNITQQLIEQALQDQPAIRGADEHNLTFKRHLLEFHNDLREQLGLPQIPNRLRKLKRQREQDAETQLQSQLEKLREATRVVSPTIIPSLREILEETWDSEFPPEAIPETDLLICFLLNLEPQPLTTDAKNLARLNGHVPQLLQAFKGFQELEPIPLDNLEHFLLVRTRKRLEEKAESARDMEEYNRFVAATEQLGKLAAVTDALSHAAPESSR